MKAKNVGIITLILFIVGIIVLTLILFSSNSNLKIKINSLDEQNNTLKSDNKEINKKIVIIKDSIDKSNISIQNIVSMEKSLEKELSQTQNQLNQIKTEYEKASNYSRNFNGDSIRLYFSNLK
jgi:ABC-type phosphate transport system auxiliary subunit